VRIPVSAFSLVVLSMVAVAWSGEAKEDKPTTSQPTTSGSLTELQRFSYSLGMTMGANFKAQGIQTDPDWMVQGMKDAISGAPTRVTPQEAQQEMAGFQRKMMEKMQQRRKEMAEEMKKKAEANKKAGDAFLAENKKKEGVVALASGVQYKVIKQGDGAIPKASDMVRVHYRGTLIDGTEFDSSAKRGQPATFRVSGVIKGWSEALQLMKVGSKWQLFIPGELGYGERGSRSIPPGSTLIFEVELLEILPPSTQPVTRPASRPMPRPAGPRAQPPNAK